MNVVFDLDGTVWDSEPGILACMVHTLDALGLQVPTDQVLRSHIGLPLPLMLEMVGVPAGHVEAGVRLYRDRYVRTGVYEASLYDGAVDMLDAVAAAGHTLATATSKGEGPTRTMLDHFGLTDRFTVIGAASMDGTSISKTDVLARTLAGLGDPAPSDCVLVGDRDLDVLGAAAHGIDCIGATWGYGAVGELQAAGAWAVAEHPSDVPGLVARR